MFWSAVEVGVRHPEATRREWFEHLLGAWDAGECERSLGGAVIRNGPADHLVFHGFAHELEVLLGELPGRLDGFAASCREEDLVQISRCVVDEAFCQRDRGRVSVGPQREVPELGRLLVGGLRELHPSVSDLDHEESREPVQVLLTGRIPDARALPPNDRRYATVGVGTHAAEVHPEVIGRACRQTFMIEFVDLVGGGDWRRHRAPQS